MPEARLERTRRAALGCYCGGTGWVCEDHPFKLFGHGCGAAGDPCLVCQPMLVNGRKVIAKHGHWNVIEGESH